MKILVTGAAGYLGSVLCPRFAEAGYEVIAVDLESPPRIFLEQPGIEYHSGDVLDESLMRPLIQRADVIVPLAALVGTPLCAREPEQAWAVNLGGIRLIQKMRASGQSVIFPMTNNGYTPAPGQAYATEETPMQALSVYTQSKQQAEKELF
ncbi:MAG: NAD(P)-dependent oxidoreductase, partial [Candidatus Omnitrophica bacterium]|nr:NAD(P)-dependent oxidoreductase [Candidatus Omnitrophota bacterium]